MPEVLADALAIGVLRLIDVLDAAADEIDAAFAAELRAHRTPEWLRPAPIHIEPYDI